MSPAGIKLCDNHTFVELDTKDIFEKISDGAVLQYRNMKIVCMTCGQESYLRTPEPILVYVCVEESIVT